MSHIKSDSPEPLRVVGAVMRNIRGEVLCALRAHHMSSPNVWEFPGGKMEGDEKPEETLQREIEEELGCVIDVGRLVADTTERTSSGLLIRLQTYEARLKLGQPRAKDHASLLWLPVPYLRSLLWSPPDLPTIDVLMSELEK